MNIYVSNQNVSSSIKHFLEWQLFYSIHIVWVGIVIAITSHIYFMYTTYGTFYRYISYSLKSKFSLTADHEKRSHQPTY